MFVTNAYHKEMLVLSLKSSTYAWKVKRSNSDKKSLLNSLNSNCI